MGVAVAAPSSTDEGALSQSRNQVRRLMSGCLLVVGGPEQVRALAFCLQLSQFGDGVVQGPLGDGRRGYPEELGNLRVRVDFKQGSQLSLSEWAHRDVSLSGLKFTFKPSKVSGN